MRKDLTGLLSDRSAVVAVIGATDHLEKYGAIIYRDLKHRGYRVLAVNPNAETVDDDPAYPSLRDVPTTPDVIDFVVPPEVGLEVARTAVDLGLNNLWLQPGAESSELVEFLARSGVDYDYDTCIMVRVRYALSAR
jgi:predicted CoA-binding protein